jgi:hypothetical protein
MFTPTIEASAFLNANNSEYMLTGRDTKGIQCEIRDKATGIVYAEAFGPTEAQALSAAVEVARTREKPKTASSGSDAELAALRARLAAAEEENRKLKAETPAPKRGRRAAIDSGEIPSELS